MKIGINTVKKGLLTLIALAVSAMLLMSCIYTYMYLHLPDVDTLQNIQLQVPLKIFSKEGLLIAQYGEKRRTPVTLTEVPEHLIQAILATEDQRYFEHPGVDIIGLARAVVAVVSSGRKSQGASTITMQVARNFFLSRKKTYSRKINEILLAIKIESHFDKTTILELYLNKIYLGHRAYGVGAAAQVYYGKTLNELTLAQLAMIAGLPQAPSRDNPISNPEAAKERRDHVLSRLLDNNYITRAEYESAVSAPVSASYHGQPIEVHAPYVAEMVRAAMVDVYDKEAYTGGFKVYTTLSGKLQQAANKALAAGIEAYDLRHGYRGPMANWGEATPEKLEQWQQQLKDVETMNELMSAVVLNTDEQSASAMLENGDTIQLPWAGLSWARRRINKRFLAAKPQIATDVVREGDVIFVQQLPNKTWRLMQLPDIEGALVSINPDDGAVVALNGGYAYAKSHYNRVTQAKRQPGSAFKPFIYSAALAKGYTLASVINDAPVFMEDNSVDQFWRPNNSNQKFYGPTRLRTALVKSRNLVSIRLLRQLGIDETINFLHRFGFGNEALPNSLTLALGSGSMTPMQLTAGLAVFANGGYRIKPYFIKTIERSNGEVIYQEHPLTVCDQCENDELFTTDANHDDLLPATRVITPQNAYLITSALQDVIQSGTGRGAKVLKRKDLAGKTGTTNNKVDAWFAGYHRHLVTTVWLGFDKPQSLHEYASKVALPVWVDFMRVALAETPTQVLTQPPNIVHVRIDPASGKLASPNQKNALFEIFRQKFAPGNDKHQSEQAPQHAADQGEIEELF